jgi:hypothetical protein
MVALACRPVNPSASAVPSAAARSNPAPSPRPDA